MNPKSRAQEIMVKHGYDIPTYDTNNISIVNIPMFQSEINFQINSDPFSIKSSNFPSKKKAEADAATKALVIIDMIDHIDYHLISDGSGWEQGRLNGKVTIFIDYENYNDDEQINAFEIGNPDIKIIRVTTRFHPRNNKADMTVDSRLADATDIFISCKIGELQTAEIDNSQTFIIITNDHFASCIADIYTNCFHLPNIEETYKFLLL